MGRPTSLRGAVDRRLLVGVGVVAAGLLVVSQLRRSPPQRTPAPTRRPAAPTPAPAPAPAAPRDAGADVFVWTMPTFSERPDSGPPRPDPRASRGNARFPASSGDYGIDVANLVRPALPSLTRCAAAAGLTTSISVWFYISPAGEVTSGGATQDAGPSLDGCVLAALQELAFPSPGTEQRYVSLPVPAP